MLIQPRPNFFESTGGDNVQLQNTIAQLEQRGIETEVSVAPDVILMRMMLSRFTILATAVASRGISSMRNGKTSPSSSCRFIGIPNVFNAPMRS